MKSEERGLSRKHIVESVKASLQRLQLPYIDIVIIHKADAMCPMEGKIISRERKNCKSETENVSLNRLSEIDE